MIHFRRDVTLIGRLSPVVGAVGMEEGTAYGAIEIKGRTVAQLFADFSSYLSHVRGTVKYPYFWGHQVET